MRLLSDTESAFEDPLPDSPLPIVRRWIKEARREESCRNPDAMALASVDQSGIPRVRMVLCRDADWLRGCFGFYTNRKSPKAREIESSGWASGVFYWEPMGRQLRITGRVEKTRDGESDAYFAGRPRGAQLAAWASAQSERVDSRVALLGRLDQTARRWGRSAESGSIDRPPDWGGYTIVANRIELWVDRRDRLHDRVAWTRPLEGRDAQPEESLEDSNWRAERLQP